MTNRPFLSAAMIQTLPATTGKVEFPPVALLNLPERAVQFGTGGFLRGFIEFFIDAANRQGLFNGRIVAVGSTPSGRSDALNAQDGLFTLMTEGLERGSQVRHARVISSLSRSLSADGEWDGILEVARNPRIELVFSNTTEVGITLDESDDLSDSAPRSFPGKLTAFLLERARHFDFARDMGVTVIPCELIERNGQQLSEIVSVLAERWQVEPEFESWLNDAVVFCDTLVDRIVSVNASPEKKSMLWDELGYRDELLTVCEPYRFFAVQVPRTSAARLTFAKADSGILVTDDVTPYRTRKVRILNGSHSIMAPIALLAHKATVFEAMSDVRIRSFIEGVIFSEIVPAVDAPDAEQFAREVISRFSNPYLEHALFDITLHGTTKMAVRIVPSIVAHAEQFGRCPDLLSFGFAAFLYFMRGDLQSERERMGLNVPADMAGAEIRAAWNKVNSEQDMTVFVEKVCGMSSLWGVDLSRIEGFVSHASRDLRGIVRDGVLVALAPRLESALASNTPVTQ